MKVFYSKLSNGIPVVLVDSFDNFSGIEIIDEGEYCRFIKFKKSPLKFYIFEGNKIRDNFGDNVSTIIDSTLALHNGNFKYSMNEKLSLNYALKQTMMAESVSAFELLKSVYEKKYSEECPFSLED